MAMGEDNSGPAQGEFWIETQNLAKADNPETDDEILTLTKNT